MKNRALPFVLALSCTALAAQAPPHPSVSTLGFTYSLPVNWQTVNSAATPLAAPQDKKLSPGKKTERQTIACTHVAFTARHGNPASVIVVVALPFACYGQTMTRKNLPDFAAGVSDGLKQHFDISNPVYGSYTLGSHDFWIERAVGIPKDHPDHRYTIETACSILKSGVACWMTTAAGAGGLRDFENSLVTLDGEPAVFLIPADAFTKKPSQSNR